MKEIIKTIIAEFHKDPLPKLFKRKWKLPELPKNVRKAIVFIGMRRVGKTYLMYQHMQDSLDRGLDKRKLLYINFEDDRLETFTVNHFQTILDVYFEMYPEYVKCEDLYFYFDEIQNIEGWEKFIRRLLDKEKMSIFITGSSAKSLSKEIATSLRGRCLKNEVFPLSFSEYLHYHNMNDFKHLTSKEQSLIRQYSQEYLRKGAFPEILSTPDTLHNVILQSYINAAVFRDVIDRYKLTNPHIVKLFLVQCLQNIASPLSITKIYKTLKSRGETLGRNNLYDYLEYFEDAYLICPVSIYSFSSRKRQTNPQKIYCIDTGIIYGYSIKTKMEDSASLETAVYLHLRRNDFENIYYYKTNSEKKVDFVTQTKNGKIQLYQVSLNLSDEKTKEREISALVDARKEIECDEMFIITLDDSEIIPTEKGDIKIIPYWKWALNLY